MKEYIAEAKGLGDTTEDVAQRVTDAFNEMAQKGSDAIGSMIDEAILEEDAGEIEDILEEIGLEADSVFAKARVMQLGADDTDFTNKMTGLTEIAITTFDKIAGFTQSEATHAITLYADQMEEDFGGRMPGIGDAVNLVWDYILATAKPGETGDELMLRAAEAMKNPQLVQSALDGSIVKTIADLKVPVGAGGTEVGNEATGSIATGIESGKTKIQNATLGYIVDPYTGEISKMPTTTTTELAPIPGIFDQAFLDASNKGGAQLATMVTLVHEKMSSMSTSVATYSNSMKTNFISFLDTVKLALPPLDTAIVTTQTAFSNLSSNIATYATSMTGNISTWLLETSKGFQNYVTVITAVQQAFSDLSTNIATYAESITGNIGEWILTTSKGFQDYVKIITSVQQAFSDLSSNVATYMKSMATNIDNWSSASVTSMEEVGTSANTAQEELSNMSSSVATYMKSMTSNVQNFESSFGDSMDSIIQDAESATTAVEDLQSAIDALKDKEITITVNLAGAGVDHLRHGGSALNMGGPSYAASGKSWLQKTPKKLGGTHVAETFPEIISAIPLDPKERNSPFHNVDIPVPSMQSISQNRSGGGVGGMSGNTTPINVYGEIHITNTLGDGRVISDIIKPFLLKNYSGITSS
jgi:hypothetical protein